jgi:hypothetical protein
VKANFLSIPNLPDDVVNRMQGNVSQAFTNVDTPAALVIKTVTAAYLVSVDDDVVLCDPSRASFTVSLPKLGTLIKPVSIRVLPGLNTANLVTVKAPNPVTIDAGTVINLSTIPLRLVSNQQGYWSA